MEQIVTGHITSSSHRYAEILELREAVLRIPLGLSLKNEDLGRDHTADILFAEENGQVIGCLLLNELDSGTVQLRAMAVRAGWQGRGTGRLLVQYAESFCAEKGYKKIVLHARKVALGFYKNLEYEVTSDEFTEVGIPHFMMEKNIRILSL